MIYKNIVVVRCITLKCNVVESVSNKCKLFILIIYIQRVSKRFV